MKQFNSLLIFALNSRTQNYSLELGILVRGGNTPGAGRGGEGMGVSFCRIINAGDMLLKFGNSRIGTKLKKIL